MKYPIILIAFIFCIAVALLSGQDVNFDQGNYHFYNAYALFSDRAEGDVLAAGAHTFLNPLVYVPAFLLAAAFPPILASGFLAAIHAINLVLIFFLSRQLLAGMERRRRDLFSALAMVLAAAGPMFLSEIGTTFSDIMTSIAIVAAFCLLASLNGDPRGRAARTGLIIGGALIGAAVGLKLTNAVFAIALPISMLIGWRNFRQRLLVLVWLGLGGLGGVLGTSGVWMGSLWITYGNPTFPFYNAFFGSPDYPLSNIRDARWTLDSFFELFYAPLGWAVGLQRSNELMFQDVRYALVLIAGIVLSYIVLRHSRRCEPRDPTRGSTRNIAFTATLRVAVFCGVSYVGWAELFYIQRYLLPIELLVGPLLVAFVWHAAYRFGWSAWQAAVVVSLSTLLTVGMNRSVEWGHIPFQERWFSVNDEQLLNEPAAYIFADSWSAMAWLATLLPDGSTVSRIGTFPVPDGGRFDRQIRRQLASAPGGRLRLVTVVGAPDTRLLVEEQYGFLPPTDCRTIASERLGFRVCSLMADPRRADGQMVAFELQGRTTPPDILKTGWSVPEPGGIWGVGGHSTLEISIPASLGEGPFLVKAETFAFTTRERPTRTVAVMAGDRQVAEWIYSPEREDGFRAACIPAAAIDERRRLTIALVTDRTETPAELGVSVDQRPLTIGLRRILVYAARADECPPPS